MPAKERRHVMPMMKPSESVTTGHRDGDSDEAAATTDAVDGTVFVPAGASGSNVRWLATRLRKFITAPFVRR
jgi:hypothetical protein